MQSRLPRGMAPSAGAARTLGSASPADGAPSASDGPKEGKKEAINPDSPWGLPGPGAEPQPEAGRVPPAAGRHGKLILPLRDSTAAQHPPSLSAATKKPFFTIRKGKSGSLPPSETAGPGEGSCACAEPFPFLCSARVAAAGGACP